MLRFLSIALCALTCVPNLRAADAGLSAGIAEVDVTPKVGGDKPVFIAGFGHNRKATAVHDPIMARAVVLEHDKKKIALVAVDIVGLFLGNVESIRKELPGFVYVMVSSTHNHEGPDTLGLWGASPFASGMDDDYMKTLEAGVVKAVKNADANRKPVTAKIGTIDAPELIHDGRKPIVLHDELVALIFTDVESKKPLGVLVQWNCHPETLDSKNTQISADFVGFTVKELRKSQGCPIAYFTGTVGGLMTSLKVPIKGPKGEELKDGTFEKTEEFGWLLAKAADKAIAKAQPVTLTPFEARTRDVHIPVDNRVYQLGTSIGVLKRPIYLWEDTPYPAKPQIVKTVEKRCAIRTEVGYMKLGDLEVAVIPGEIYPELVLGKVQDPADPNADFPNAPVEPSIYGQLKAKHKMLIGLGNDETGYFIPKRQWDEKPPFAYGLTKTQYGEVNSCGPETAPIICKAFADLVNGKK
jgi:hypothetical protein